jgi:hypothetical protein
VCASFPALSGAQDRPFVFSLTAATDASAPQVRADYEVGMGEQVFHQQATNGPEQRLGLQVSLGRVTFVGHVGMALYGETYQSSQQGEMLVSLFAPGASRTSLAAGGGILHEAGGANVLLARFVAAREISSTRLQGNVVLQKPLASGRDSMDLITLVGWSARLTPTWSLGVESVGEDLEGFWDQIESEGGARLLVGPSVHIAPPQKRWQLSIAGGPVFHPTTSERTSDAIRALPGVTGTRDYAVRTTFGYRF